MPDKQKVSDKFVKFLKNPKVWIVGGVIGVVLLLRNKSSTTSVDQNHYYDVALAAHQTDTAASLEAQKSNNELSAVQAVQNAQVQQTKINADNTAMIVSMGLNADIVKTGIAGQTAIAIASEQTKQVLGSANIWANRDITVNYQNTERDKWVTHDTNQTMLTGLLDNNQTALQLNRMNVNRDVTVAGIGLQQTAIQSEADKYLAYTGLIGNTIQSNNSAMTAIALKPEKQKMSGAQSAATVMQGVGGMVQGIGSGIGSAFSGIFGGGLMGGAR